MTGSPLQSRRALQPYAQVVGAIAITGAVIHIVVPWVTPSDASMLFLLPVLWAAVRLGRWPSVFAALVGAGANNFLFFPPTFAFGLQSLHDLVTLTAYLVTAVTTGNLAGRVGEQAMLYRQQANIARARGEEISALYQIGRHITAAAGTEELGRIVTREVGSFTKSQVALLLLRDDDLIMLAADPPLVIDDGDRSLAAKALATHDLVARAPSDGQRERLYIPMYSPKGPIGLLVIGCNACFRDTDRARMLMALADHVAVALANAETTDQIAEAKIRLKADQFRSTLLNSVSHDFRTPLGAILGAATSLLDDPRAHTENSRLSLLTTIRVAAEQLNRYVHNLLDISRIESGALVINREWVEVVDLVSVAVQRVEQSRPSRPIAVSIEHGLPLLRLDFVLIEQVLVNLLDNAAKFSRPEDRIEVTARHRDSAVRVDVFNEGPAVPLPDMERLFEKFYRSSSGRVTEGSGLGLAICRGFMVAHDGRIEAIRDNDRKGMIFRLTFPDEPQPDEPGPQDE